MGHWLKWRFLWMFIRKSAGMLMNGQCCASIFLSPTSSFISKEYISISYCSLLHLSAFTIFFHRRLQYGFSTEKISWAAQRLTWASISFFSFFSIYQVITQWIMDQVPLGNKRPRLGMARLVHCPACRGIMETPVALSSGHVLLNCIAVEGIS